jgi:hypothetical protein
MVKGGGMPGEMLRWIWGGFDGKGGARDHLIMRRKFARERGELDGEKGWKSR